MLLLESIIHERVLNSVNRRHEHCGVSPIHVEVKEYSIIGHISCAFVGFINEQLHNQIRQNNNAKRLSSPMAIMDKRSYLVATK